MARGSKKKKKMVFSSKWIRKWTKILSNFGQRMHVVILRMEKWACVGISELGFHYQLCIADSHGKLKDKKKKN